MALTYVEYPESRTVEFTVTGHVSREDYDSVFGSLSGFAARHRSVRIIEVTRHIDGLDPSLLLPGPAPETWQLSQVSHVAVVTGIGWFSPVVRATGGQAKTRLRLFDLADLDKARAWIADPFVRG